MTQYEEDIQYAKDIVELRNAFIKKEFRLHSLVSTLAFDDSVVYRITNPHYNPKFLCRLNTYGFDGRTVIGSKHNGCDENMLTHHNAAEKLWLGSEYGGNILRKDVSYTEEFHFQCTLMYSDEITRNIMLFAYLAKHPMKKPYKYFSMNLDFFDDMKTMLTEIRNAHDTKQYP